MREVTIDGRQLSYPGTGLALVTAELINALDELGYSKQVTVFVEPSFNPDLYNLSSSKVRWLPLEFKNHRVDYLGRLAWAKAVVHKLRDFSENRHFIPYLYNYGNLKRNIILIPDLVYKIFPDYGVRNPNQPWWNLRGRLPIRPLIRRWEEWLVTQSETLVVYSEFVRQYVQETLHIPIQKMTLIPLATPSWMIQDYTPEQDELLRKTLNLPEKFVLYVGGFAPRKNTPMLLQACGQAYEIDPSFRCVVVGLTSTTIQMNPALAEAMQQPNVQQAIIPLPNLSYQDLASIYRLAAFTVYPSATEGFGLPVLEAAAAGKLCLCGDNSSMQEIQLNPDYRINSAAIQDWVTKMLFFWQDSTATAAAGQACAAIAQRYSWHQSAEQLWQLLQS